MTIDKIRHFGAVDTESNHLFAFLPLFLRLKILGVGYHFFEGNIFILVRVDAIDQAV